MTTGGVDFSSAKKGRALFAVTTTLLLVVVLAALGLFAWLGIYSRYLADDYCEAVAVRDRPGLGAVIDRYTAGQWRATDRYSNLLLVSLSESLGPHNLQIISFAMILIWAAALAWIVYGVRRLTSLTWPLRLDYLLAVLLAFLTILQAPNRFQTLYWRSSMATHFAPLVFLSLLIGFLLYKIRSSENLPPSLWTYLLIFLAAFLIGGFSEPPAVVMLVLGGLALLALMHWGKEIRERFALTMLIWALAGTTLALLVMLLSPAHRAVANASPLDFPVWVKDTLRFPLDFLVDSFKVLPLPAIISMLIPALLFFCVYLDPDRQQLTSLQRRIVWFQVGFIPVVLYILIAASFAPSAYGQSYPVERARFLARFLMTAALMIEGALVGILAARSEVWVGRRPLAFTVASIALLLLALYPMRSIWISLSTEVPQYEKFAAAWDARDAQIRLYRQAGEMNITVPQLPDPHDVRELRDDPNHWINRCAADFYGVQSVSARP